MKTVEITTKYLEYYINLFDKAVAKFEKIDSSFERRPMWVKLFQTALHATEIFFLCEGTCYSMEHILVLSSFKKLPPPPQPLVTTTLTRQADHVNMEVRPSTSKKNYN